MCESERFQNVKGYPISSVDTSERIHRGEGESPIPPATLDEGLNPYLKAYYKATGGKPHE